MTVLKVKITFMRLINKTAIVRHRYADIQIWIQSGLTQRAIAQRLGEEHKFEVTYGTFRRMLSRVRKKLRALDVFPKAAQTPSQPTQTAPSLANTSILSMSSDDLRKGANQYTMPSKHVLKPRKERK